MATGRTGAAPGAFANDWNMATPEEVGLDSAPLVEMFDFVRARQIPVHSIQVVRAGRLALDAYFFPYSDQMRHDVASVTKSVTSTLVGLAIEKGFLPGVEEPVLSALGRSGQATLPAAQRKLTLRHLLTMQAGWDCGFEPSEKRLFEMRQSNDWLEFMLQLPFVVDPGTRWAYCSGNCHLLSAIVARATGTSALAFARRDLFEPLGIRDLAWPADPQGNNHGWGDLQMHPRDMAKLGLLFLGRGQWSQRRILSESWVKEATRAQVERTSNADRYGYFWWVKGPSLPGMFEAVGRGGQRINVWPEKELVLVFTGGGFEPGDLSPFLLRALKSDRPLPANPARSAQLKQRLAAARRAPLPGLPAKLPATARRVSDQRYQLSRNNLQLTKLALEFSDPAEARVNATWDGHDLRIPIGLDGVERFSTNPLNHLPQAAKGHWLDQNTFVLHLDLAGGINFYTIALTFSDDARRIDATMKERTGLDEERFSGTSF